MEKRQTPLVHPYSSINIKRQDIKQILYDSIELQWGQQQQYSLIRKIGRGRYSFVFQGRKKDQTVAIKVLLPIKPSKIKREYHILTKLNHPSVVKILDIVRCPHLRTASVVLEYFPHQDFRELYQRLNVSDIKYYGRQLFEGLNYIHSQGIIHRDIKPFNVLINEKTRELKIIDFGLSEYYFPSRQNSTKVGSQYYKAPQLHFGNTQYDYRVDCWAAGLIIAGMIFRKAPFFVGNDNVDQILKLTKMTGTKEVVEYIKQNKLAERKGHKKDNICFDILVANENGDIGSNPPSDFSEFINDHNKQNVTAQGIDLLKKLLVVDYRRRYTAKQVLEHPFFKNQ